MFAYNKICYNLYVKLLQFDLKIYLYYLNFKTFTKYCVMFKIYVTINYLYLSMLFLNINFFNKDQISLKIKCK